MNLAYIWSSRVEPSEAAEEEDNLYKNPLRCLLSHTRCAAATASVVADIPAPPDLSPLYYIPVPDGIIWRLVRAGSLQL